MKSFISSIPIALGIILLSVIAGWTLRGEYGIKVVDVRWVPVKHYFELPSRLDTVLGQRIRPSAERTNTVDSTIGAAVEGDTLAQFAETLAEEFWIVKDDSIAMSDSLLSISIGILDSLRIDPLKKIAAPWKRVFHDINVQSKHKETTVEKVPGFFERMLENPWVRAILYILGIWKIVDLVTSGK